MRRLVGIMVLVSLLFAPAAAAQEKPSQHLPADLLYVTLGDLEGTDYQRPNMLMRLDADTLASSIFYYDSSVWLGIIPLVWSPTGTYLAVIRDNGNETVDLCLITQTGVLHQCFEEVINRTKWINRDVERLPYWVTWSDDEQSLYFYQDDGDTIRLVEGDIASGKITQVLYERTTPPYSLTVFYWPQSLSYVVVSSYREMRMRDESEGIRGNRVYDVEVVRPNGSGNFEEVTAITPLFDANTEFCSGVSPDGTQFIALHYSESGFPEIWFVDPTGAILEAVPASDFQAQNIWTFKCPTWQPDSSAIYFFGQSLTPDLMDFTDASLYRYVLGGEEPVKYTAYEAFGFEGAPYIGDYLAIALDGTTIAFSYTTQNLPMSIGVATDDGEVLRVPEIRPYNVRLMWFPEDK